MLEDAAGIRRVVLACGTVDLRKGIDGLAMIIGDQYGQNPFEKGTLSSSAASGLTAVKDCFGWGQDSCFCIKDLKTDRCPGQGIHRSSRSHGRAIPLSDDGA